MTRPSDEELVAKTLAGSEDAAAELFRRYWAPSWRAAAAVVRSRSVADDVTQDAFQHAFRALPRFDTQRRFGAWLHRIVINRALDVVRSERRLVALEQRENGTLDSLEGQLRDRELFAALWRLDPERRAIVALRYWLDYSPAEIAELLEVPVGTVSSRLSRALAELRNELEGTHV
jgi:RNA polymerase sigma-70 factor (ECF subfamily)